ncbi:MAG TPA: rhodanese-like domain-containing protein [Flavobacteriales bacterium]|nr:rhodanese-like domain-containing protein [Flavobacteriales bacterium]
MSMLRTLLGLGPKVDLVQLIESGATIVDVRTAGEYAGGHVKGSVNIPLDQLMKNMKRIPKGKPVITCCASGMRSGSAASSLRGQGYDAHNAGPWTKVNAILVRS